MAEDWQAVATEVGKRMAALRITQAELAEASGVSVATLRELQKGSRSFTTRTLKAVARGLALPDRHLVDVVQGKTDDPPEAEPSMRTEVDRLARQVETLTSRVEALEEGAGHRGG